MEIGHDEDRKIMGTRNRADRKYNFQSAQLFNGLRYFAHIHPDLPHGEALIYGGNETQTRTDVAIHPFNRVHELLSRCDT
jgi:hypothetical protein